MIEISNLSKRYHTLRALDNVTLSIPEGEVLGLLGPNGAGKTTLLKLIAGLIHQDSGRIRPTSPDWPAIGLKTERLLFPNHLRVNQYLTLIAGISSIPNATIPRVVADSLSQVGLLDAGKKPIRNCSKGMRQRLALAQALIGDPQLILLDEPSNGLDPEGQKDIHQIIKKLHSLGKTIVMSSHQLHEVTDVCTHVIVLNRGRIHYENSMADALPERGGSTIRVDKELEPVREYLHNLHPEIVIDGDVLVLNDDALKFRRQLLTMLLKWNYDILEIRRARASLAEIYAEAVQ